MILYELAAADGRRFSPHCWKSRMSLAQLGIDAASERVGFMAIRRIGDGGFRRVPVLENEGEFVADSWQIAEHLDRLTDQALFPDSASRAFARFTEYWVTSLFTCIGRIVVPDIATIVCAEDHPYFEESRERWLGEPIDLLRLRQEDELAALRERLDPARRVLAEQPFLGGAEPTYSDFQLFGAFQWARVTSPAPLVTSEDPIRDWFQRCLDLYDGLGRSEPGYDW